jgi:hypothetical protein
MDVLAFAVRQHQIRAFTFGNHAAIVQIKRRGRVFVTRRIACAA